MCVFTVCTLWLRCPQPPQSDKKGCVVPLHPFTTCENKMNTIFISTTMLKGKEGEQR